MTTPTLADALRECRDALAYHQEQTRPIQRTADALTAATAALAAADAAQPPADERAAFERWMNVSPEHLWQNNSASLGETAWRAWLGRASLAQAPTPSCCAECGRKDGDGWALYCVDCISSKVGPALAQPLAAPAVAEEMVDAYLKANDAYWQRADELHPPIGQWRAGTSREATRVSLAAAITATEAAQAGSAQQVPAVPKVAPWCKLTECLGETRCATCLAMDAAPTAPAPKEKPCL